MKQITFSCFAYIWVNICAKSRNSLLPETAVLLSGIVCYNMPVMRKSADKQRLVRNGESVMAFILILFPALDP